MSRRAGPAEWPPFGLPGLDPAWSRHVESTDADGIRRTFHVLDSGPQGATPDGTLLCVHGNPTWSYLWRALLATPPPGWRVIAPDHLGMGYSERTVQPRRLAQRIDDLGRLTDALELTGPVVTVAHDWGGIISLGWAEQHPAELAGVVLTNTAVHQPADSAGPILIRAAHLRWVTTWACVRTPLFVRAATALSRPRLPTEVRDAFAAPYRRPWRRVAVGDFVTDIPFATGHPSRDELDQVAAGLADLAVPALILWGPRDPVFGQVHLRDLLGRLPQAVLHRYEGAGHLLPEDAPGYAAAVRSWVREPAARAAPAAVGTPDRPSLLAALRARSADLEAAVVEVGGASISWADLHRRIRETAGRLIETGLRPGQRVALLIPPSIELTVAVYAVWWSGGVVVLADKGLGLAGMGRALRSARVDLVVAEGPGRLAAILMRLPGRRIAVKDLRRAPASGRRQTPEPLDRAGDEAAVLFTSGATGPAKGVRYRHRQLRAQLAAVRATCRLTPDDRIVAAFAPFALYGPALGIRSAVPDTDVTRPGRLTARALAAAASAIGATVVFASPAALTNVLATSGGLSRSDRAALGQVRLLMSAGAPVPAAVLRRLAEVLPNAEPHTPYGMTEVLPVTDISLAEIEAAGPGDGVCVGRLLPEVEARLVPTDTFEFTDEPGRSGEIWIRAAHLKDSYDGLWQTDQAAAAHPGWHRTGDVGMVDRAGRWWIQGRTVHVIRTEHGPVTPVGVETRVQHALRVTAPVAAVGVGPAGIQQVVVVLTGPGGPLAPLPVAAAVREVAAVPVAAVLIRKELPVDIRHNSKIDRTAVAAWAAALLAGG